MGARLSSTAIKLGIAALILLVLIVVGLPALKRAVLPRDELATVATATVEAMREQNKLSAFAATFAAPVTTTVKSPLGLTTRKTSIFHGTVQYDVDLSKLGDDDVRWNAKDRMLIVRIPPVELQPPAIDINNIQEYGGGGVLATVTDSGRKADLANRQAGVKSILAQARGPLFMRNAREAHRRAVQQLFALPLRAAGLDARVEARYADEKQGQGHDQWDLSRPIAEVYAEAKAKGY